MSNIILITGVCVGIVALLILGAYLKYRKIDIKTILTNLETFLKSAENYTTCLEELATGKVQKALNFASLLEKAGETAIKYAEQLLLSGQIADDVDGTKRKAAALDYIYAFLEKEGIKVDDNVKLIANGIVESGVLSDKTIEELNTKVDKLIQEKVTPLEQEKNAIKVNLDTATNENLTLKQQVTNLTSKISTIQSTVDQPAQTEIK